MSFILDALKKSENDRQDSAPTEFTTLASGSDSPAAPRWLWLLGGLLVINALVLGFMLLRPAPAPVVDAAPPTAEPSRAAAVTAPDTAGDEGFATRVAEARRDRPRQESAPRPAPRVATTGISTPTPRAATPVTPSPRQRQTLLLPTLTELRANGTLNLPDMHLDIHVYSDSAEDRFVFINMSKYRERDNTREGPDVDEITPEGVVLQYQGQAFLLPRD